MISPVVDQAWLAAHPHAKLADVRHYLDGRSGADTYAAGHIPGAVFVAMDDVLADPPTPALGRHPLPDPRRFAEGLGRLGISEQDTVVAYDDAGGAIAARLVWLLRILGRDAALLDGGLSVWDGELTTEIPEVTAVDLAPVEWPGDALASIDEAAEAAILIDARAPERFRGEHEPIDPKAGHIPGAKNYPLTENLTDGGRFKTPEQLQERFAEIADATDVVSYCGSGITACHNLIALEHAGLGRGRLYPGSWSQYSGTERPVATGD